MCSAPLGGTMAGMPARLALWRARALDARLAGRTLRLPEVLRPACETWLTEVLPRDGRTALGLTGAPPRWSAVLGRVGVPLAPGPLCWGDDLDLAEVARPVLRDCRLLLPGLERMRGLSAVDLKPLRLFIRDRLGCRLQAAPGIRLWLWPRLAVLQSLARIPLAGFLYGDAPGHRTCVSLPAWGYQVVDW